MCPQVGDLFRDIDWTITRAIGASGFEQLVVAGTKCRVVAFKAPIFPWRQRSAQFDTLRMLATALNR